MNAAVTFTLLVVVPLLITVWLAGSLRVVMARKKIESIESEHMDDPPAADH